MNYNLIAFTGFAGSGKDEAAIPLIKAGYTRHCFGDIIKGQLDPLVQKHLGFSAFTEDRPKKAIIRAALEHWGEANYAGVFDEFFSTLPEKSVNTRLCRVPEAEEWIRRGGIVVEVRRAGVFAETEWADTQVASLHSKGLINLILENSGTVENLHSRIAEIFLGKNYAGTNTLAQDALAMGMFSPPL